ncbi:MAG: 3-phosphoshikimate 1-carboxyvinyltransferase [Deltaproteobacteria bacterium GWA2_38_16]|nr:MAG: 3-phosphoshikimate 1-carboxyvinyltransferase [Deltaproteobacteria bacterium GWA2_38_16]OGQ03849.1 MAG: 3-phosphoshikimate 1-carboxyvinyltransferase [Deltaproteobacteria bacterium RIFCSPHIGHO2_02_FULL_38_15]OGQ31494.1 MAG: 3-phosphoshikimate 1-carboxyvinyltransferase [Deltaproteobacteria bacterium RIFCSPLOWO2_01_FULL_38_9]HBQ20895.1 3-phosphoshikimate 1-carboxyvinyltransferase [Deltaproteobacteria bacterium]
MSFLVPNIRRIYGRLIPPPDKSISHRALMLSALAQGKSEIKNFLRAEDCLATARALKMMGVEIIEEKNNLCVSGQGLFSLKKPSHVLDVGDSGTTLRLLTGILSAQKFSSVITGGDSLVRRPVKELLYLLRSMGAHVEGHEDDSYPPVHLYPVTKKLVAITCKPSTVSAQIKSALLLAGLYVEGQTVIQETIHTRDHTERLLKLFGAAVREVDSKVQLTPSELQGQSVTIPGDISAASFFITLALLLPESELEVEEVGLNFTRTGFLDVIQAMGATCEIDPLIKDSYEPTGRIFVKASPLKGVTVSKELTIRTIDELPLVALLATQAHGETKILDAGNLRFKESDRLKAVALELSRLGAHIEEEESGLVIQGPTPLKGAKVKSYHDHRMAMMLMLAGMISEGETQIDSIECISKSFPNFLMVLGKLSE